MRLIAFLLVVFSSQLVASLFTIDDPFAPEEGTKSLLFDEQDNWYVLRPYEGIIFIQNVSFSGPMFQFTYDGHWYNSWIYSDLLPESNRLMLPNGFFCH